MQGIRPIPGCALGKHEGYFDLMATTGFILEAITQE